MTFVASLPSFLEGVLFSNETIQRGKINVATPSTYIVPWSAFDFELSNVAMKRRKCMYVDWNKGGAKRIKVKPKRTKNRTKVSRYQDIAIYSNCYDICSSRNLMNFSNTPTILHASVNKEDCALTHFNILLSVRSSLLSGLE